MVLGGTVDTGGDGVWLVPAVVVGGGRGGGWGRALAGHLDKSMGGVQRVPDPNDADADLCEVWVDDVGVVARTGDKCVDEDLDTPTLADVFAHL